MKTQSDDICKLLSTVPNGIIISVIILPDFPLCIYPSSFFMHVFHFKLPRMLLHLGTLTPSPPVVMLNLSSKSLVPGIHMRNIDLMTQ